MSGGTPISREVGSEGDFRKVRGGQHAVNLRPCTDSEENGSRRTVATDVQPRHNAPLSSAKSASGQGVHCALARGV